MPVATDDMTIINTPIMYFLASSCDLRVAVADVADVLRRDTVARMAPADTTATHNCRGWTGCSARHKFFSTARQDSTICDRVYRFFKIRNPNIIEIPRPVYAAL